MLKHTRPFKSIIVQRHDVIIYEKQNIKYHLIGTNHASKQSMKAIKELISRIDPDVVTVELCLERLQNANILVNGREFEKKYQDLLRIPANIRRKAVGELSRLLMAYQALKNSTLKRSRTSRYRVRPIHLDDLIVAGDIFTPFGDFTWTLEPNSENCLSSTETSYKIVLADMPISETYSKLVQALSDEEKSIVRSYKQHFVEEFTKNPRGIMGNMWYSNKNIRKIVLDERDQYLANSIVEAATMFADWDKERIKVVAVVGRRHVDGISSAWKSQRNS